jgi:hypothetical protein
LQGESYNGGVFWVCIISIRRLYKGWEQAQAFSP